MLLGDLLLQMPHTTACVFVAVMRILSFSHINSDFVQLRVPDPLVYTVPSKKVQCDMSLSLKACTFDRNVMPANRQLTMTVRGTTTPRMQY